MEIDKTKLKDDMGRPLTQGLFLEIDYNADRAVYTLKDEHHVYEGKTFYSLKQLYIEMEDIVEYEFATTYLLGWKHWQRLNKNKVLSKYFEEWREELELSLRSQGVRAILDQAADDKAFQAAKWVADKGWDKRTAGRPSKQEKMKEDRINDRLADEFSADIIRMKERNK